MPFGRRRLGLAIRRESCLGQMLMKVHAHERSQHSQRQINEHKWFYEYELF